MTDEGVTAEAESLQGWEMARNVLQGGQLVLTQVKSLQGVQVPDGLRVEVDKAGVVRDVDGGGDGQVGECVLLHPPEERTVPHLERTGAVSGLIYKRDIISTIGRALRLVLGLS